MQLCAYLVVAAVVLLYSPTEGLPQRIVDKMESAIKECQGRFKISADDLETFRTSGMLKDEKAPDGTCFVQCVMEEMGMVKDGIFSTERKMQVSEEAFKDFKTPDGAVIDIEKMRNGVTECAAAATGDTTCAKNYSIWVCLGAKRQEVGL
ncbi:uncharacterized protein LOC124166766 [Ischnura elegans]|uniref:uncharacterized protein LOC124166766 n=1 Tax=Ischnura elegans TaxID=197161 RepID=UPI001ED89248|nr:uncharacterized protein LOC124166766 [Ischnura elegans]